MPSSIATWSWKTWFLNAATTITATACIAGCENGPDQCSSIAQDGSIWTISDAATDGRSNPDSGIEAGADAASDGASSEEGDAASDASVDGAPAEDAAADSGVSDAPVDG